MNISQRLTDLQLDTSAPDISNSLMISKNSQRESYSSVCAIETPRATPTHTPVPNALLLNLIVKHIHNMGWEINAATYASSYDQGNLHFVFELNFNLAEDSPLRSPVMQIGGHNSHIKMRSIVIQAQTKNPICTNMDVIGEVALQKRHTTHIMHRLNSQIGHALTKLSEAAETHAHRLEAFNTHLLPDLNAHGLMIQAMRQEAAPATYLPIIANEWHNPSNPDSSPRNLLSLYNCFTEAFKKAPAETPRRSQKLLEIFDKTIDQSHQPSSGYTVIQ